MRGLLACGAIAILVGACGGGEEGPGDAGADAGSQPDSSGLEGLFEFDGLDPSLPSDDLDPLWALVGDARLIGLGESVHTSGGFYAAKDRLIRVLVEEHGVRVFAMETPRTLATDLEAYLQAGVCDQPPDVVLASIFGVFADDNTYDLMQWICTRNAANPADPVRFFGFDMQQPEDDSAEIDLFVTAHAAPAEAAGLLNGLDTCSKTYMVDPMPSAADHMTCLAGLDAIDAWIAANEASLIASAGERSVRLFKLAVLGFRAWQEEVFYFMSDSDRSFDARDFAMAQVFEEILSLDFTPTDRVVIWAHNFHLAMEHDLIDPGYRTFGSVVHDRFGAEYAPVCITAYGPGINWPGVGFSQMTTLGTSPGETEAVLHLLLLDYLIIDPNAPFLAPQNPHILTSEMMIIPEQFTAIVYLDVSPPMDAVFW